MPTPAKVTAIAAVTLTVLGGAWTGASVEAGRRAEAAITALASAPTGNSGLRVKAIKHERNLLSATGGLELHFEDACGNHGKAHDELFAVQVDYKLSHLLGLGSAVRFDWSLRPMGQAGADFAKAFGNKTQLEGQGSVDYAGDLHSSLALPELSFTGADGQRVQISPSTGKLAWGKTVMGLDWKTDSITARGNGQAMALQKLALNMDLRNRFRGTGSMSLGVDKLSTSGGGFDGLKVSSQVTEHGDRLDMVLSYGVQNASVAGQTAKNLTLEMALKDVHAASFETISRVASDSCGLQNLTTDEDSRVRSAVRTLLASGLSMGIPKLAGTVGEGSLDGQLSIDLMATKGDAGGTVALAKLLKSSGKLTLSGNVLNANQKQMAVAMGVATETPKGLEAAYEYVDGIFKANGRVFDAGKVQTALASADQEINRFLNTPRLAANKATAPADAPLAMPTVAPAEAPAAPAEAAPVSAPTSAPISAPAAAPATAPTAPAAPVAAAAGNCDNVQACMAQSLRTAAREDLDTLRSVATRIEALPKPDLGNKAVARKLNTEALEALKREDHAAAVETLRRALQENPRDVEVASNLGFAQVRAGRAGDAVATLTQALVLDPRRTSTWTPLAEALALTGRKDDALAALWVGYQWSANRDKSRAFYAERAEKERATRPALADLYATVAEWTGGGRAPALAGLARN